MNRKLEETINIIRSLAIHTNRRELIRKVYLRLTSPTRHERDEAIRWAASHTSDFDLFLDLANEGLQNETRSFARHEYLSSREKLKVLLSKGVDLGGGAHVALLHFLTLRLKPKAVLETGVAAGHSSFAILSALKTNGVGKLYSSDFPYFRINNSLSLIGTVVPQDLKQNWHLYTNGDTANLPQIFADSKSKFQLVHYDSDKRKKSRKSFLKLISPHLDNVHIIIFDDIQDDLSFRDHVLSEKLDYLVFEWEGKYLGCIFSGVNKEQIFSRATLYSI